MARHERCTTKGEPTLVLDHYLEVLLRKPGALPGATALVQARKSGALTTEHEAFWAAARAAHGDAAGTRELIEVLLLHRHLAHPDVIAGLRAAAAVGASRADVVAVEARKAASQRRIGTGAPSDGAAAGVAVADRRCLRRAPDPPRRDGPGQPTARRAHTIRLCALRNHHPGLPGLEKLITIINPDSAGT